MKVRLLIALTLLGLLPASCAPAATDYGCADTLRALADLRATIGETPAHLQVDNPVETGAEFDPNAYFTVFDHLTIQAGYTLDYTYTYDGMGGYPTLYARENSWPPFLSAADLRPGLDFFLNHVQTDDTPESFLQLAILSSTAEQFYLIWHANYNDQEIVCSRQALKDIVNDLEDTDFGYRISALEKAQALDLQSIEPVVTLEGQTATVSLVTFTLWGGFYRLTFTIDRAFPHIILNVVQEQIAPYNCGVSF